MKCFSVILVFFLTISNGYAATENPSDGIWNRAKGLSHDAWEKTKSETEQVWASVHETGGDENTSKFLAERDARFKDVWGDVLGKLEKGLNVSNEIQKAPDSAYFGADKKSLKKDLDAILEDVMELLFDKSFAEYRDSIESEKENIADLQKDILSYREARISAPEKSMLHTTKRGYKKKIVAAKREIKESENKVDHIKKQMGRDFQQIGVNLSPEQIDVLMARIDGNDIIQMTLVMDALKQVTTQLMTLMADSNEELTYAKKYYGMHMILLELVIYVQDKYIHKVDKVYLPKVNSIVDKTLRIRAQAKDALQSSKKESRAKIYRSNIEAHDLTLKVAKLYAQNLSGQRSKVLEAQAVARKDLKLARNTYETVAVSADLYAMISNSKNIFSKVMNLQVPEIIPFENLKMKNKYQELTSLIQGKE